MPKSKKRGGEKVHRKRVQSRNTRIKAQQEKFIEQFRKKLQDQVAVEIDKEAQKVKEEQANTEDKTVLDTQMSTPPVK